MKLHCLRLMLLVYRSTSPGKLLHFLVDDGSHVKANEHYAEIEVMKMVTFLTTTESGMYVVLSLSLSLSLTLLLPSPLPDMVKCINI